MIRIYLAGEIQIESERRLIRESDLPARQGRLAFAQLASTRDHSLASVIATAFSAYQLRLPADVWVDLEVAAGSLHQAEAKVAAGRPLDAYGEALGGAHDSPAPVPGPRRRTLGARAARAVKGGAGASAGVHGRLP